MVQYRNSTLSYRAKGLRDECFLIRQLTDCLARLAVLNLLSALSASLHFTSLRSHRLTMTVQGGDSARRRQCR